MHKTGNESEGTFQCIENETKVEKTLQMHRKLNKSGKYISNA